MTVIQMSQRELSRLRIMVELEDGRLTVAAATTRTSSSVWQREQHGLATENHLKATMPDRIPHLNWRGELLVRQHVVVQLTGETATEASRNNRLDRFLPMRPVITAKNPIVVRPVRRSQGRHASRCQSRKSARRREDQHL